MRHPSPNLPDFFQELTPALSMVTDGGLKLSDPALAAVWHWDLRQGTFTASDAFYALLDADPSELAGRHANIVNLLEPRLAAGEPQQLREAFCRLTKHQQPLEQRLTLHTSVGARQLRLYARPLVSDHQVVAIEGLTELLPGTMPDQLRLSEAFAVLHHIDIMVFCIDSDGTFLFINHSACRKLGYSTSEICGHMQLAQLDAEHSEKRWSALLQQLAGEQSLGYETLLQRHDGTIMPAELCLRLYPEPDGEKILVTVHDLTQYRMQEARLQSLLVEVNTQSQQLRQENLYLQEEIAAEYNFDKIISASPAYDRVLRAARSVAVTDSTVLITGETGTGKELLARAIHKHSRRRERPMVSINCAALPRDLIESELFGHERGAFTGAVQRKAGRFEIADGGTLFLDEVGELPADIQVKLLRVLQEGEFDRVGGTKTMSVDVRIIAATNRDLEQMVREGTFRADLYYRLNVFPIENIPLRRRPEDIPLLVGHFVRTYSRKLGKKIDRISPRDLARLKEYTFPGNIRELENLVERSVILSADDQLNLDFWQQHQDDRHEGNAPQSRQAAPPPELPHEVLPLDEMQRRYIIQILERTNWRVSGPHGAASLLGLKDQTLFSKMRRLGIEKQ